MLKKQGPKTYEKLNKCNLGKFRVSLLLSDDLFGYLVSIFC